MEKEDMLQNEVWIRRALDYVRKKADENLPVFRNTFPAPNSENLIYPQWDNLEWTPGFYTGMLWLLYEVTGDQKYLAAQKPLMDTFQKRLEEDTTLETHDIGFLYSLSTMAGYKVTGEERYLILSKRAAYRLMDRYHSKARIIQAWGNLNDPKQRGRMIIDCLMNLSLLYDISSVTGDRTVYEAALHHAKQAEAYLVREDFSTYHTFYMDVDTGEPVKGTTSQGYSDRSAWARGQAWGVYGFALSYIHTGEYSFLKTAMKIADYYLERLPKDFVPYWDLYFQDGDEYRDSSAAGILACGLLEIGKRLPLTEPKKYVYEKTAVQIVKSLSENYTTEGENSNGVLKHAVYSVPHGNGVDECCIWGDYFYLEALVRLLKPWNMYW